MSRKGHAGLVARYGELICGLQKRLDTFRPEARSVFVPYHETATVSWLVEPTLAAAWALLRISDRLGAGYNTLSYEFTVGSDDAGAGEPALMTGLRLDLPNPVMVGSEVRYRVPSTGPVLVDVLDVHGRLVRRLVGETVQVGEHGTRWDGRSETGVLAGSGVYFFRLTTDAGQAIVKCVLLQ